MVQQRDVLQQRARLHDADDLGALPPGQRVEPRFAALHVPAVRLVVVLEVEVEADDVEGLLRCQRLRDEKLHRRSSDLSAHRPTEKGRHTHVRDPLWPIQTVAVDLQVREAGVGPCNVEQQIVVRTRVGHHVDELEARQVRHLHALEDGQALNWGEEWGVPWLEESSAICKQVVEAWAVADREVRQTGYVNGENPVLGIGVGKCERTQSGQDGGLSGGRRRLRKNSWSSKILPSRCQDRERFQRTEIREELLQRDRMSHGPEAAVEVELSKAGPRDFRHVEYRGRLHRQSQ